MRADNALRFLAHEEREWANLGKDEREMVVLLIPGLLKCCGLAPLDDFEAAAFKRDFKAELQRDGDGASPPHPGKLVHLLR